MIFLSIKEHKCIISKEKISVHTKIKDFLVQPIDPHYYTNVTQDSYLVTGEEFEDTSLPLE